MINTNETNYSKDNKKKTSNKVKNFFWFVRICFQI